MKYEKITKNSDYRKVYEKSKSFSDYNLVIFFRKNNEHVSRIGIATAKKINLAVKRNKVKRKLREIVRKNISLVKKGYDVVILCRINSQESTYRQLEKSYIKLLGKTKLLKNNSGDGK